MDSAVRPSVDLIVCWPRPCDYPAFRAWVAYNRFRFGQVFVVFTELEGRDLSDFVRTNLPDVTFLESQAGGRDWRDAAVNAALDASTASTVLFMEQDFEPANALCGAIHGHWPTLLGWDAGDGRAFHPSFLLVRRTLIDQTSRYFGPVPVDHFYTFGAELCALTPPVYLPESLYRHYQAISESQMLLGLGQQPKFHPEQFREWLEIQFASGVALEPEWEALMREELARA